MSGFFSSAKYFLPPALRVLAGAATAITGSYLLSRIQERQERDQRLARLEQLVEKLAAERDK